MRIIRNWMKRVSADSHIPTEKTLPPAPLLAADPRLLRRRPRAGISPARPKHASGTTLLRSGDSQRQMVLPGGSRIIGGGESLIRANPHYSSSLETPLQASWADSSIIPCSATMICAFSSGNVKPGIAPPRRLAAECSRYQIA